MKKFFAEFKTFITRGNVIDMAVGVTVGSAFTAIVTAVSNNILKPVINFAIAKVIGADTLKECYTFLGEPVKDATGAIDLTASNYIDWGAFVSAIINFLVIAFVLFCIVKAINTMTAKQQELGAKLLSNKLSREQKKELKAAGICPCDKDAVSKYFADKAAAEEAAAAAKAAADREANPTTEDLLKKIVVLLESK